MTIRSDGGPVFPKRDEYVDPITGRAGITQYPGMSLRDYFAAKAMQGLAQFIFDAAYEGKKSASEASVMLAGVGYAIADAMIAEREK